MGEEAAGAHPVGMGEEAAAGAHPVSMGEEEAGAHPVGMGEEGGGRGVLTSGLTSGMTRGTPSVMRKALLLSTTKQPFSAATGPSFLLMLPPALNRAMSTSSKLRGRWAGRRRRRRRRGGWGWRQWRLGSMVPRWAAA
jgi:hypothetical protein